MPVRLVEAQAGSCSCHKNCVVHCRNFSALRHEHNRASDLSCINIVTQQQVSQLGASFLWIDSSFRCSINLFMELP